MTSGRAVCAVLNKAPKPDHSVVDCSRGSSDRSILRRAPDVPRVLRLSISGFGLGSVGRGSKRFRIKCLWICNASG